MKKACYAQQMRDIDKAAEEIGKIPSIVLMENAALAIVGELKKDFPDLKSKSAVIFCGSGNNGGDGFCAARHLYNMGVCVRVYLVSGNGMKGDAGINFDIIKQMGVDIEAVTDTDNLDMIIRAHDIVIDAIFGTGVHGEISGLQAEVIRCINENSKYTLAVDVPSGINSDMGEICGVSVRADKTVTFAAYKIGMLQFPAADFTGETVVSDISIPDYIIENQGINVNVTDSAFVRENMPMRADNSQKGDYGKVLIIAGSRGMSGAAYLASEAAVTMGSGLVTLAVCEELNDIMEVKTTEVMTIPLKGENGHISAEAAEEIIACLDRFDAVLIGPGLGLNAEVGEVLSKLLTNSKIPVIVDADGINAAARDMEILKASSCPLVFTPHTVEMARLTKKDRLYIEANRFEVSAEFAERYGASILLKGHHTIVTAPNGIQYINITGNSGLATGGSGDVLAGIIVSLAARGIDEAKSAAMAAYIHGMAGDIAKSRYGAESVTATRVIECLPDALCQILQVENRQIL